MNNELNLNTPKDNRNDLIASFVDESISADDASIVAKLCNEFSDEREKLHELLVVRELVKASQPSAEDEFMVSLQSRISDIESASESQPTNIRKFIPHLTAAAAAAVLLCSLGIFLINKDRPEVVANVEVQQPVLVTLGQYQVIGTNDSQPISIIQDEQISSPSGIYKFQLNNGATMTASGPFSLTVTGPDNVILESGVVAANCPSAESTIKITRGEFVVQDLGTTFIVDASTPTTKVEVISGEVSTGLLESNRKLTKGQAVSHSLAQPETIQAIETFSDQYADVLEQLSIQDSITTQGDIRQVNSWDLSNNLDPERSYLALEKTDITGAFTGSHLTSNSYIAGKSITKPQTYHSPQEGYTSYLLRTYPKGGDPRTVTHDGEITFPSEIVAVITSKQLLIEFEQQFQLDHTQTHQFPSRAMEGSLSGSDSFTISPDRKTLKFSNFTHTTVDDLRILVEN